MSIGCEVKSGQDCCCILLQLLSKASMLYVNTSMLVLLTSHDHGLLGCQHPIFLLQTATSAN